MARIEKLVVAKPVGADNFLIVEADDFINKAERLPLRDQRQHFLFEGVISLHKGLR